MAKHTPAAPGPWHVEGVIVKYPDHGRSVFVARFGDSSWNREGAEQQAKYFAHAANAYPRLVDALSSFLRAPSFGSSGSGSITLEVQSFNREAAVKLLKELGEGS